MVLARWAPRQWKGVIVNEQHREGIRVDVSVESTDPEVISAVEAPLQSLQPEQLEATREILTVLTVAAAVVALAKGLVDLWKSLRHQPDPPKVTIEVASGDSLVLTDVSSSDQIHVFLEKAARES
jgi:hypothetical protein